jgi:hypothetical protein
MEPQTLDGRTRHGGLKTVSLNRLVCLSRHWAWADEARGRFERTLSSGWDDECDPLADRMIGAYYHWCALLCGIGEAAIDDDLLAPGQRDAVAADLHACLSLLRRCRQVLVTIPTSREEQPRLVDVLRDGDTLRRLRHVHDVFGDALRDEQGTRDMEFLDSQER